MKILPKQLREEHPGFVMVPNQWVRTGEFKPTELFILANMLSHKRNDPEWTHYVCRISAETELHRTTIYRNLLALKRKGYVTKTFESGEVHWKLTSKAIAL